MPVDMDRSKWSAVFFRQVAKVRGIEGDEFTDDKKDSGGKTKYGITEITARAYGYLGPMPLLPWEKAEEIYYLGYWVLLNLDDVAALSESVAAEVFDTGVNCRPGLAARYLQRALNVLNREEKDYPDIQVDGLIGTLTVTSLKLFLKRRGRTGELVLLRVLNSLQGARYVEIAEARKKDERFTFGWFLQRVQI